ncbi:LCP family protein [Streptomyces indicus]|uniref:Cell envelope-related function transcriptional attenuator common domain-containing protein n=1 Tax=Streptomyces indicus TaxID=417292 RepID=A0A1G8WGA1_9ACTN|nr:LCP family protein [Streptomyces indicus]SDJ77292.1 cell envelope-related function transcriptional attenuator common domain-containing protein [Streptomyces indicus]
MPDASQHQPEDSATASGRRGGKGRRRKPRSTRRKALVITAWTAAGVVVLGGAGLGYLYYKFNGNLHGVDINAALGTDRPEDVDNGSMDILVLGSDSRAGDNSKYGGGDGESARSDTAMILHVYEGHKKASVVSIPRDTLVTRPECTTNNGGTDPGGERRMFNESYSVGGPACAVKTVESMSGIRMDHYVEVDFSGFKKLIDTLGGVDITTSKAISDPDSHLNLPAGEHTLNGEQALGLVRTRHAVGDGGDLGRIQLQQAFIKALINQIKDVGVFSSPKKLFDLADTATKATTVDSDLDSVNRLVGFANGLKSIDAHDMKMVTLPVVYDQADPNRVVPLEKQSQMVWDALKADRPIPAAATKDSAGDKGDAGSYVDSN